MVVLHSAGFYILSGDGISSATGLLHGSAALRALSNPATQVSFQAWSICPVTDTFIPHFSSFDKETLLELRRMYPEWLELFGWQFAPYL